MFTGSSASPCRSQVAPLASVELISPLPSPAAAPPRVQRRSGEGEDAAAGAGVNQRRKRIMETVFTKPITRRKKL